MEHLLVQVERPPARRAPTWFLKNKLNNKTVAADCARFAGAGAAAAVADAPPIIAQ